jgi:putative ABC transport system permease protein
VGISSFWFIADFVKRTHQYDAFHENQDRIYRLSMEVTAGGNTDHYAVTGLPPGQHLYENFPGIDAYANFKFHNSVVHINNEVFKEQNFFSANPEALDVFTFELLDGDRNTCFSNPNSILLSSTLAEKYFRNTEAIGKQIIVGDNQFLVTGVFDDWPKNSHLYVNAIIHSEQSENPEVQDWFNLEHYNYLLLEKGVTPDELNDKLKQLSTEHLAPMIEGSGIDINFKSEPLRKIYFSQSLIDDVPKGSLVYVNALMLAGILVLLIAGLNYINLTVTRSSYRIKEILMKRLFGISRIGLFRQRAMESGIMTILVLIVSTILIYIFDRLYYEFSGYSSLETTGLWPTFFVILMITFFLGLIGNGYPGIQISFSSLKVIQKGKAFNSFQKILLGLQFAIASIILIVTLVIFKQVDFIKDKELGFSKDEIMIVSLPDNEELKDRCDEFRDKIKQHAEVTNATLIGGGALPGEDNGKDIFQITQDGEQIEKVYNINRVDEYYFELLDIQIASGRNFQAAGMNDLNHSAIINESLVNSLNWDNPLGKTISYGENTMEIIGVVKNFHNKSLHNIIEPIVFMYDLNYPTNLLVKSKPENSVIIGSVWSDFFPDEPLSIAYFDQFIESMYAKEDQLARLLSVFTIVSLILSCMGLFAVFSLQVIHKTKEMSVRKVLGANPLNLFSSITSNYFKVALISILTSIPLALLFTQKWLQEFSYRIQIDPFIFILSAGLILFTGFIAILYHLLKILTVNPVDSLKYE